ncbi:hypothetical protein [Photorhabdus sp. SF281]|uniref:hypothetical protein n=1 Tax=Photorhabdus sp. SF281 TaxID=3459527 RepID=UPI00404404BC
MNTLSQGGVECYMPVRECFVPRPDRKSLRRAKPKALFPCYMFVFLILKRFIQQKYRQLMVSLGLSDSGVIPAKYLKVLLLNLNFAAQRC